MKKRLIFGCGYLGLRVAQRWRAVGDEVFAMTRSKQRAAELAEQHGLRSLVGDVTQPGSISDLPEVDTVLWSVGFDRTTYDDISEVYVQGLQNSLDRLPGDIGRFIYISSTGVYGQRAGESVDESSATEPESGGGRASLAAERIVLDRFPESRGVALRLAGIYGPGRVPRRQDVLSGEPMRANVDGYLNLIHVDDAADVVAAVAEHPHAAGVYNVADGHPVIRREYYEEIARQLDSPPPTFAPLEPDSPKSRRGSGSKRVDNSRLLAELDWRPRYPSYREGLAASLKW